MIVVLEWFGNREDVPLAIWIAIYATSSLFFAGGLTFGILVLRRMKVEGPKGIMGRALIGMVLNGLLLCGAMVLTGYAIYAAELTAWDKRQEASANQKFEAELNAVQASFSARLKELQGQYYSSWAALTNPPVLDMAGVKNLEDLKGREKKVAAYIAACNAFLQFSENPAEAFQQELMKQPLHPKTRERMLNDFTNRISGKTPQILALRQGAVHQGDALLKAVTYLDTTWTQWNYVSATKQIQFKTTAEAEKYEHDLKDYYAASDEMPKLKEQVTR